MIFDFLADKLKSQMVKIWSNMKETDKKAFVDQVALMIAILGQKKTVYRYISDIVALMIKDGSTNLSDFGIYAQQVIPPKGLRGEEKYFKYLNEYRFKHELPAEPHKALV